MRPCRVFIHGSCVCRDTVAFASGDFAVVHYQARQSLISVGSRSFIQDPPQFKSSFQQRMFDEDTFGNVLDNLREKLRNVDLILLDLCDERLGVQRLSDGSIMTRSVEGIAVGFDYPGRHIPFGSDEHFSLWAEALHRYVQELDQLGVAERVLVLAAPWAASSRDGVPAPSSFGLTADVANQTFARYYHAMKAMGMDVQDFETTYTDAAHKWGPAPFHYDREFYATAAAQIMKRCARQAPDR